MLLSGLSRNNDGGYPTAIPKKGSRLITVDGDAYRWRIRRKPTYCQGNGWGPLTFSVEAAGRPGRVLLVALPFARPDAWLGERTTTVRPALVAAIIRTALERGWDPQRAGSTFTLDLSEDDLADMMSRDPPSYGVPFMRR
ncbi:hypothetical protein [Planomonospora venezuelensis]|uniref:Uncharacterized protein n=1 Tax=Planomonospora venezuelensis TaxID=1999 RepID=A0A841D6V2_PLAVE|nr:hypothetical protein [Planomonospora venezuelensis]MBB5964234.1 hypothetical protein [Planomonospora venezuelensis]GIN02549.1 hypothetical protein Pve01_42070 [Planomonospora venezuelensis]